MPESPGRTAKAPPFVARASSPVQAKSGKGPLQRKIHPQPAGPEFQEFMYHLHVLEQAARSDGWGFNQTLMALRKIHYGGFAFDMIIPAGANQPDRPPSWDRDPKAQQSLKWMRQGKNKEILVNGAPVDMHHVFAGLDARRNPSEVIPGMGGINAPGLGMSRNIEAATYVGDLGSVVGELLVSYYAKTDTGRVTDDPRQVYGNYAKSAWTNFGLADFNSDVDSYAMNINASQTVHKNLYNYYHVQKSGQGYTKRYTNFARRTGLTDGNNKLIAARVPDLQKSTKRAAVLYLLGKAKEERSIYATTLANMKKFQSPSPFNLTHRSSMEVQDVFTELVVKQFVRIVLQRIKNEN